MQLIKTDANILALTMIGEARGEGDTGMIAVGNTVMNRVALKKWFGLTPAEVCLKPYQYSCWNLNDPNRVYLNGLTVTDPVIQHISPLAQDLINGSIADLTGGATHYYARGTPMPPWAEGIVPCITIGNHFFFKGIS